MLTRFRDLGSLAFAMLIFLAFAATSAWSQEWTGRITIPSDPTTGPNFGKPLAMNAYIPDVSKPIRAAMIMGCSYDDQDWRRVAKAFNCLMISTPLNAYDERPKANKSHDAQKIVAALNQASKDFPAHPEIQYTCVTLCGWSYGSCGACFAAGQPELADRVLAVVAIHEIDGQPWLPPLSVPHLFISAQGDGYSVLKTHDRQTRDRATDQGAPLTMVANVNHSHVDIYDNNAFTRVWLEEVFKQRLPDVPPTTQPVVMPDWKNHAGWLGAYDVAENTNTAPWGNEQRLMNVVIAPRADYRDSRKYIWLPSKACAEVWQVYSSKGMMPTYGTLTVPTPVAPAITVPPENQTVVAGKSPSFSAKVTGTPPPTYSWKVNGKVYATGLQWWNWKGAPTTLADDGAEVSLTVTNVAGSATRTVTLKVVAPAVSGAAHSTGDKP